MDKTKQSLVDMCSLKEHVPFVKLFHISHPTVIVSYLAFIFIFIFCLASDV